MSPVVEAAESPEHKRLVKALIDYLNSLGFATICAAYAGFDQCTEIEKHIPDVEGKNTDELIAIGEAKTCDDLDNDRTKEQFKVFSHRVMAGGKSKGKVVPFSIAVTKGCEKKLEETLNNLGLSTRKNINQVSF
jgi:ribosomal protein L15